MSMSRWRKAAYAAGAVLLGAALAGCGEPPPGNYDFTGDVTRIVDGDTFYMTGQEVRVRIWGLAAPERGDPDGPEATRALADLITGQTLGCELHDTDRYGRPVAQCFLPDGRDIAAVMIEGGTAEEYCRYSGGHYGQCG